LILALWTLGLLSVFSFYLGVRVRQKATVLGRIVRRSQVQSIAEAGVRKAKAVYDTNPVGHDMPMLGVQKEQWMNNPYAFRSVELGNGAFEVSYLDYPLAGRDPVKIYGITDEERRINLNTADAATLGRLIEIVSSLKGPEARALGRAIVDWRQYGESEVVGFFSDAFYENLEFPYPPKKEDFEILDELLLVKGMTEDVYRKMLDFVTVYGKGKVNINTASGVVLNALGLSPQLVQKIVIARRGPDGREATADDALFFVSAGGVSLTLPPGTMIRPEELGAIDDLFVGGRIGVTSVHFRIQSRGRLSGTLKETMSITCVFHGNSGKIFYWNEKRGI